MTGEKSTSPKWPTGTQTLLRGLDVLDVVAQAGAVVVPTLVSELGLSRTTANRLANALVTRGLLTHSRDGYSLGCKLLELGHLASQQMDLPRSARAHLLELREETEDTVHLGVLEGDSIVYLDKLPGRRKINISSNVGDRQPIRSTSLGKALILDEGAARWREIYRSEGTARIGAPDEDEWLRRMHVYADRGAAFDVDENDDQIRGVAAPVRGVDGRIVAAISVSGAAQYMDRARMSWLAGHVRKVADRISRDLGWSGGDLAGAGE